jgi:hypothetical protein
VLPVISYDLRSSFGTIRDQGSRPTCVAFAVSDAHAVVRGPFAELSVEHLFYHAVQRMPGGHPAQGVSLPCILQALHLDGQAAESGWPYLPALPPNLKLWAPPASATPVFKRAAKAGVSAAKAIIAHLNAGSPVVVAFMASMAFCMAENGVVQPKTPDSDVDWHAVIAVGHGDSGGKPFLLVRNSWGESWGMGGYAWVDVDYLAPRINSFATIT